MPVCHETTHHLGESYIDSVIEYMRNMSLTVSRSFTTNSFKLLKKNREKHEHGIKLAD